MNQQLQALKVGRTVVCRQLQRLLSDQPFDMLWDGTLAPVWGRVTEPVSRQIRLLDRPRPACSLPRKKIQ